MNKFVAVKSVLLALVTSPAAMAHEGHGLEGMAHDTVHNVWILSALLVTALAVRFLPRAIRWEQSNEQRNRQGNR